MVTDVPRPRSPGPGGRHRPLRPAIRGRPPDPDPAPARPARGGWPWTGLPWTGLPWTGLPWTGLPGGGWPRGARRRRRGGPRGRDGPRGPCRGGRGPVAVREAVAGARRLVRTGPGRVRVQPALQLVGRQVDAYPARAPVQVTEDRFAVAEPAQDRLMLLGGFHAEQRQHALHLGPFRRTEREDAGDTVRDLLVQQVPGVLRDEDQRGVPGPAHPGHLRHELRALGRGGDGPGLVEEDRLGLPPVHPVQQPARELRHQVEQRHRQPLLIGVVVPADPGVRQGQAAEREHRGPALRVDLLVAGRREAQPGQPHLGDGPHHVAEVLRRRITGLFQVPDHLAQARPRPGRDRANGLDHRALAFLAHPRQQQPQRLRGHGPLRGQVVAEGEGIEQPGRRRAQGQHPCPPAARLQQPDQRRRVALGVDHRDRRPAQRELVDEQQGERRLPATRLPGDRDGRRPVARDGQERIEMHDGPGPAERLADVRADPADSLGDPVTQVHGGGRHATRDRVQRLPLQVGAEPHPVAGQRFTQQRELIPGRVNDVDPDVPVVLDDGLDAADTQAPGGRGHDEAMPPVDERQAFLGDAVLQHARRRDLLRQRDRRLHSGLPDVRVHVARVSQTAADVLARLRGRDQPHPRADLDRERQRVREVQPRFPVRERHHVGEPGEGQVRGV